MKKLSMSVIMFCTIAFLAMASSLYANGVQQLLSPDELKGWIDKGYIDNQGRKVVILDTGFDVVSLDPLIIDNRHNYDAGHIPGAYYVSPSALSNTVRTDGPIMVPFMVPCGADMDEQIVQKWGIDENTAVVFTGNTMWGPTRYYWTFRYWGFKKGQLFILNGVANGSYLEPPQPPTWRSVWEDAGYVLETDEPPQPTPSTFSVCDWPGNMDTVRASTEEFFTVAEGTIPNTIVVDARPEYSFLAQLPLIPFETTNIFAFQVQNSIWLEWSEFLVGGESDLQVFKSEQDITALLNAKGITQNMKPYSFCQGGGAATVNFFVFDALLDRPAKIHDGSSLELGNLGYLHDPAGPDKGLPEDSPWRFDREEYCSIITPNVPSIAVQPPIADPYAPSANRVNVEDKACYFPFPDIPVDIKPGSCPNPMKLKCNGVLPVAILGTDEYNLMDIDPQTIMLTRGGVVDTVAPIRYDYEDVGTPFEGGQVCSEDLTIIDFEDRPVGQLFGDEYVALGVTFTGDYYDFQETPTLVVDDTSSKAIRLESYCNAAGYIQTDFSVPVNYVSVDLTPFEGGDYALGLELYDASDNLVAETTMSGISEVTYNLQAQSSSANVAYARMYGYYGGISGVNAVYTDNVIFGTVTCSGDPCDCHELNGDGYMDLTLKFKVSEVIDKLKLYEIEDSETIPLTLTGLTKNCGTPIRGEDCIWIIGKLKKECSYSMGDTSPDGTVPNEEANTSDPLAACSNDIVEPGEDCDPPGACCAADCTYKPGGTPCPDDKFCNGEETCNGMGTCVPGTPVDCSVLGVDCTDDICDEDMNACVNSPNDDNCPEDGLYCNGAEICGPVNGCYSTGDPCPDGTVCNEETNTCDPLAACGNDIVEPGEECDPPGTCCAADCTYKPGGTPCPDDKFCNGEETCNGMGTCEPGTPVDCSVLGVDCTDDSCDEDMNACVNSPNDENCPEDGLYCNGQELCDPVNGCYSTGDPCLPLLCDEENSVCVSDGEENTEPDTE